MESTVLTFAHGNIMEVAFNRPQAYNAFDLPTITEFADRLTFFARDDAVRGIVITGKGPAFCAGGDLKWVTEHALGPEAGFHALAGQFHRAVTEVRRMAKPVVAAIQKVAAGGGFSLALACDFRVMEQSARLQQAYTQSGLCLDGGGTFTLPRLVGLARSLEIAAFDEPIPASKALEWGLATKVVQDGKAVEEAVALCSRAAKGSLSAFGRAKKLFTDSMETGFETQMERERAGLAACAAHPDGMEGLRAFKEKTKPVFDKNR